MGNPCVSHSITETQIDDNYELLCRLWSPLVGAEEGGLSTPIARSTQRVNEKLLECDFSVIDDLAGVNEAWDTFKSKFF